jgi:hypothetical protein
MPILTYTNTQGPVFSVLSSRVLIGRLLGHGISYADASVSRLHAWIDPIPATSDEPAHWRITDAGSRGRTFINDQPVYQHSLQDGDVIRVGKFTLTYHEQDTQPAHASQVTLSVSPPMEFNSGILFQCTCGAPLWVAEALAGKRGMCRHCRRPVTAPSLPTNEPAIAEVSARVQPAVADAPVEVEHVVPAAHEPLTEADRESSASPALQSTESSETAVLEPPAEQEAPAWKPKCSVCHSVIEADEPTIRCPDCDMVYHDNCWQENFGCSSYGCPQVDSLRPPEVQSEEPAPQTAATSTASPEGDEPPAQPLEPILLAGSIIGSLVGALMFGGLAAIVAIVSTIVLLGGKHRRTGMLLAALVISVVGLAAGLIVSDLYYLNARHLPHVLLKYLGRM